MRTSAVLFASDAQTELAPSKINRHRLEKTQDIDTQKHGGSISHPPNVKRMKIPHQHRDI